MALNDNSALEDCIKESDWVLLDNNETYCSDCHIVAYDIDDNALAFSKQTQNEGSKFLGNVV
jgi:hypothetical protein